MEASLELWKLKRQEWRQGNQEVTVVVRDGGGQGNSEDGEKWMDLRCVLETDWLGFADGLAGNDEGHISLI